MDIIEIANPVPSYFAGTAGEQTVAKVKWLIKELHQGYEPTLWNKMRKFDRLGFLGGFLTRFYGSFQGDIFKRTLQSSDTVAYAVAEPDFERYYWAPGNRAQVASLAIMFFDEWRGWFAIRIVSIHKDGRIVGVHDFGATDHALMPNNVKYANLHDALRQHVKDSAKLLPEHA